jgi:peptide/nickel transport system ATP-binding protein
MPPLLELRNVKMYYGTSRGTVKAVDGISFRLNKGEAMALVGESGSGKSSLAFTIIRLLPRNVAEAGGEILFYDEELGVVDLAKMNEDEIRRKIRWKKISMVFQASMNALNPILRVQDQMIEPLVLHLGLSREEAVKIAEEALRSVGLAQDVLMRYPFELSGGMKQRVVIAMAIMMRPRLVILDEPTSALDVITQANIMNLLKELKTKFDLSYILITHDIALASEIADKIGVMYAGRACGGGTCRRLLPEAETPLLPEATRGDAHVARGEVHRVHPGRCAQPYHASAWLPLPPQMPIRHKRQMRKGGAADETNRRERGGLLVVLICRC